MRRSASEGSRTATRAPSCVIIFNPKARGEKSQQFIGHLEDFGRTARLCPTQSSGHATELAREAVESGAHTVVAAGGDGTVNEVANGIALATDGFQRARLAVLPLGTVNVFAKELGIPAGLKRAWDVAMGGTERQIDLPFVEFEESPGFGRRYFVQMAGAGLDSRAIDLVSWRLKKKVGPLAYVWASARALRAPSPRVVAEVGGKSYRSALVGIGNGRFLAGRFPVFPRARLDDGLVDVTIFPRVTLLTIGRVFPRLLTDTFARSRSALHLQSTELRLTSPERMPLHVEGDNVGFLPARIGLVPRALRVACPA
jgi:diacylglycerol kinase (ATP)